MANNLMHESGLQSIKIVKENGSWTALDDVENLIIPPDLEKIFNNNPKALENYEGFAPSYRKSYLYWLNQAKRETTREKRITEIVDLCNRKIKSRGDW